MSTNIRSAVYSNIHVYELVVRGIAVMIRKSDGFVNATQILRAAGLPKPARTKVLEREVTRGVHEKVQGGYAGSQGTWIPLDSALSLAEQYHIYTECAPLFSYDMLSGAAEASSPPQKTKKPAAQRPAYSDMSSPDIGNSDRKPRASASKGTPSPIIPITEPSLVAAIAEEEIKTEEPGLALRREARTKTRLKNFAAVDEEEEEYYSGADTSRLVKRQRTITDDEQAFQETNYDSPMAGKKCAYCGVTETPQWRRGPSGKRTLCNACGVKWSSGRLHISASSLAHVHSSPLFFSMSETETNHSSDHGSGVEDNIEVGTTAWKLQLEVARLKSKLRETEKSQKKLEKLLAEGKASDRELDRCYRKILSGAKKSQPTNYSAKHSRKINDLFHKYEEEYEGDLADDEGTITVRFGDSSERERYLERTVIAKFVESVRNKRVQLVQ